MKKLFKFVCLFAALTAGITMTSCSGNEDNTEEVGLSLSASPASIVADGVSFTVFTVKMNGMMISTAKISCTTTGEEIADGRFTTTTAGSYQFVATAEGMTSNTVTVTATELGEQPEPTEGLVLSVDKTTIEANGTDVATLIITENGVDVTADEELIRFVSYSVVETGESAARSNTFSAIANGTYTIKAKYKGNECANTVTVEAVNRGNYEKYHHMVVAYDITNLQCPNCVPMAESLENAPAPYGDHVLTLAIHGPFSNKDPWLLSPVANDMLVSFGSNGYPTVIYDLDETVLGAHAAVVVGENIRTQMMRTPATTGVKLESSYDSAAGMVKVKVSMTATEARKYDIGCALVLDNQIPDDWGYQSAGFKIVNDIVVNMSGNYARMSNEAFTATVDTEVSREFDLELPAAFVEKCGGIENFSVAGFTLCEGRSASRKDGVNVLIDNAATCALGASIDYRLN